MRPRLTSFIMAGATLLVGLSSISPDEGTRTDDTTRKSRLAGAVSPALKPWAKGLMTRKGLPPQDATYVDNAVVHVHWRDLERNDQEFDFPGSLWSGVAAARARGLQVRLRVFAGIHAPDFVKAIHPPDRPFHLSEPDPDGDLSTNDAIDCSVTGGLAVYNSPIGGCIPYFWTPLVLDQYQQLMQEIARRFDQTEEGDHVLETVSSACSTVFAEPFYRAHRDLNSNLRLWAAGLDESRDLACHQRAIQIHNDTFVSTRTSLAVNPWDIIDGSGDDGINPLDSWAKTEAFVTWARGIMGEKLVIQNNGLGERDGCPTSLGEMGGGPQFCFISSISQPIGFQTETFDKLGGLDSCTLGIAGLYSAIDNAVSTKASFVELPKLPSDCGDLSSLDQDRLNAADRALEANAPAPTTPPTTAASTTTTTGPGCPRGTPRRCKA